MFGPAVWFLTLLNGFWILFSTQLGLTDTFSRTVTDMLWSAYPGLRKAQLQMPAWRMYVIMAMVAMFAFFTYLGIQSKWTDILKLIGMA